MQGWHIRPATAADARPLAECIAAAYAADAARLTGLPAVSEGIGDDIRNHAVWVAEDATGILGGVILVISEGAAKLANVAVRPDAAGKGLGRALIAVAEEHARAAGQQELQLATHVGMPRNLALYRRLGWQESGREGVTVLMSKRL